MPGSRYSDGMAAVPEGSAVAPPRRGTRGTARLDRAEIVAEAVALADRGGLASVSMRRLGAELKADPMSLYRHVSGKDELLDAMVDAVVGGIPPVPDEGDWRARLRALAMAARATALRHPWLPAVMRERPAPTPAGLRHLERLVGILRTAGMPLDLVHHAIHVLGSRAFGFSQDLFDDSPVPGAEPGPPPPADAFPFLAELAAAATHEGALGPCDDDAEFAFALDLTLEGLARRFAAEGPPPVCQDP